MTPTPNGQAAQREVATQADARVSGHRLAVPIDSARGPGGAEPEPGDVLELGDWVRPVLLDGRAVLLLQAPVDGRWAVQPRSVVKRY